MTRLVFTNRGSPCYLRGYPTITGLDDSGHQVFQATHSPEGAVQTAGGGLGALTVRLNTGESASAYWRYLRGLAAAPDPSCPRHTRMRVSLPGAGGDIAWSETRPEGSAGGPDWTCHNQVGLIIPGVTGAQ